MNRNCATLSMTAVCCRPFRPTCFFLVAKTILSQEIILAFPLGPGQVFFALLGGRIIDFWIGLSVLCYCLMDSRIDAKSFFLTSLTPTYFN